MQQRREARGIRSLSLWVAVLALSGCGLDVPPATGAAGEVAEAAQKEPYPGLARVPPRPTLGYPVEQRREMVRQLVADREKARYEGGRLRYRLLGAAPPTAPALAPAPARSEPSPVPAGVVEDRAYLRETIRRQAGTGELDDLLDWLLERDTATEQGDPGAVQPVAGEQG